MTLVNIKDSKIMKEPADFLRIFLGLIFLTAGVFRIFHPEIANLEFTKLQLPAMLSPLMIFFEIGAGLLLIINRFTRAVYYLLLLFMIIVLIWALILDGRQLFMSAGELFVFNLNPTDFFLHFTFLIIIVTLLRLKK